MSDTSLRVHANMLQGTEEWEAVRRGIVTASVVGKLITTRRLTAIDYTCPECAASPHDPCRGKRNDAPIKTLHTERAAVAKSTASPTIVEAASNDDSRALTMSLAAERITGWTDPTFISNDMLRGIEDEPWARKKYAEHFAPVREVGFMVREGSGFRLGYSPDGLVGDDGLIEIKSRLQKKHLDTILSEQVPAENMAQCQAGLLVSGRKWLDYVSYCEGMPLWVKRVRPDEQWFAAIVQAVRKFEDNTTEMVRIYSESVAGLPLVERAVDREIRI
ncbi:lambda exonuclease family protein [Gordonia soli]|uniref:Uncharacterized protein n=1 Tax=Gordonia soli NBRC 108243 TaxID=1223545 RepID=M0QQX1_9ACTN|nr:lambda exonuclease family protein [Gordonia soli]GAC71075.1 hypothetical protein GS4_51_00130 [Gordonia soli NBRC 108243]